MHFARGGTSGGGERPSSAQILQISLLPGLINRLRRGGVPPIHPRIERTDKAFSRLFVQIWRILGEFRVDVALNRWNMLLFYFLQNAAFKCV